MPVNRNALIRYRTLDNCLRNKYRQWTLKDLIEACSEVLYEYEGIDKGVSRRTVQMDLQMMRSDKLGYNAPIVVIDKKYYMYKDPDYSITNIPLTDQDLGKLTGVVQILRQFKGFTHFHALNGMVQRLEDRIHTAKTKQEPVIDLEKNENLKGLEFIDTIYQSIIKQKAIRLSYQSFKARNARTFTFHPYFLKEYRNRWFILGIKKKSQPAMLLALDRILAVEETDETYIINNSLQLTDYFQDVVGVSVNPNEAPEEIELYIDHQNAPYVLTKPLHHSQKLLENTANGIIIQLSVQLNFELEREILGFGDCIKVLKPEKLKRRIQQKVKNAAELYEKELKLNELESSMQKIHRRGFAILEDIYTTKEVGRMLSVLSRAMRQESGWINDGSGITYALFKKIPQLKSIIFNANLCSLIREGLGSDYFLAKATYLDKPVQTRQYNHWQQQTNIHVKAVADVDGFDDWIVQDDFVSVCPPATYLQNGFIISIHLDNTDEKNGALTVVPKTHFSLMTNEEIRQTLEDSNSKCCKVARGGIQIMKPLLLHATVSPEQDRHSRIIHLEFNNLDLPQGMEWVEKEMCDE